MRSGRTGKKGEEIAEKFLRDKGYKILYRNFRTRFCEIDLVALSPDGVLCIIEVKTRKSLRFGAPEESITPAKIRKLEMCAQALIQKTGWQGDVRFDVISITLGKNISVNHIKNAIVL